MQKRCCFLIETTSFLRHLELFLVILGVLTKNVFSIFPFSNWLDLFFHLLIALNYVESLSDYIMESIPQVQHEKADEVVVVKSLESIYLLSALCDYEPSQFFQLNHDMLLLLHPNNN